MMNVSILGDELRQKIETEQSEIERLHQEVAELRSIREELYVEDSSTSDSSAESDDDDTLNERYAELLKENKQLEVSRFITRINLEFQLGLKKCLFPLTV